MAGPSRQGPAARPILQPQPGAEQPGGMWRHSWHQAPLWGLGQAEAGLGIGPMARLYGMETGPSVESLRQGLAALGG